MKSAAKKREKERKGKKVIMSSSQKVCIASIQHQQIKQKRKFSNALKYKGGDHDEN